MASKLKVSHHIKKLLHSLPIQSCEDSDIDLVIKNLKLRHKEYELEPIDKFRNLVLESLTSVLKCKEEVTFNLFIRFILY